MEVTYLEPSDRHFRCVGMNLPWWHEPWRRNDPEPTLCDGDMLLVFEAPEITSLTDSLEPAQLPTGEGGSNFNDNLK